MAQFKGICGKLSVSRHPSVADVQAFIDGDSINADSVKMVVIKSGRMPKMIESIEAETQIAEIISWEIGTQ